MYFLIEMRFLSAFRVCFVVYPLHLSFVGGGGGGGGRGGYLVLVLLIIFYMWICFGFAEAIH